MEKDQDSVIVEQVMGGNIEAFGLIIEKYQNPLFNLITKMTNSANDAEDLLQIVFIKTYEKLSDFNPDFKFFSWIYRIAVNETINYLKSKKKMVQMAEDSIVDVIVEDEPENSFPEGKIQLMLNQLKEEYKILITLKYFQSLSYEEISQITGIRIKVVKSRLYMARNILKEMILKNM
jgi:RNA polymerase sigma-70 factor (ECF subfamily)